MDNPQQIDIDLYRWSTHKMRFKPVDADGNGVDLTNHTGVLQIRADYGESLLLELDNTNGVSVDTSGDINASGFHYVDVTFLGSVIGPVSWDSALYDLFVIDGGSGYRYVLAHGAVLIDPSIADFS